ncbi:hypothetical protein PG988_006038 [Apiospora saccharicola]
MVKHLFTGCPREHSESRILEWVLKTSSIMQARVEFWLRPKNDVILVLLTDGMTHFYIYVKEMRQSGLQNFLQAA